MLRLLHRFRPYIIDVYVFKEILQPFFTWLFFFTTLFMTIVIKDILGDLVGKGIDPLRISAFMYYLLAEKITQTVPLACLLSGILAAGRLSGDSEITAMRASGISFPRIYSVFLFFGFLTMLFMGFMNLYYGPLATRERQAFQQWLQSYHSMTLVRPGQFLGAGEMQASSADSWDIYASGREGSDLTGVQIRSWNSRVDPQSSEKIRIQNISIPIGFGVVTRVIQAQKGRIVKRVEEGKEVPIIHLEKGYMVETNKNLGSFTVTDFEEGTMDFVLPPPKQGLGKLNVQPAEYTFPELFEFLEKLNKGEHEISPEVLQGGAGTTMADASKGANTIRIPSPEQLEVIVMQTRIWLAQNCGNVGKPGGPSQGECNAKMQYILQLQILAKDAEKKRNEFEYEIHSRLASPLACMLFFFVSFPLGMVVKRSGKGMSFSLALVVLMLYYILLSTGASQALSGKMKPWQGAYLPIFGIGLMGIYIMASRTEGFTPLRFLSAPFRWIYARFLARFLDPIIGKIPLERIQAVLSGVYDWINRRIAGRR